PGATVGFSGMTLMVAAADPFVVELDALGAVAGEHARVASNGSKVIPVKAALSHAKIERKTRRTLKPIAGRVIISTLT
ncbi:MAG: hypothetical protein WB762_20510, partial [Candidatus Sulfotelmatobacter sp.]